MKVYVYGVMDYEKESLETLVDKSTEQITCTKEQLTISTLEWAKGYDGVSIHGYCKVDSAILQKMKELGILHISTRTIGYDHIDVATAKNIGIHVYNAHYEPNNVADFTVMMMLIMLRKAKVSICRALVNDFSLDGMIGREMKSLTIGVIGTGKIGTTVIHNLSGFNCRILAYDPYPKLGLAEYVDLDRLYAQSDIITLHIPLSKENFHMINQSAIKKMKKGVIIINTARGSLIDTDALIEAIENEHIGGAGIDTIEDEVGIMHTDVGTNIVENRSLFYLKQFPNVLYTQHYAFFTQEAIESMVKCGISSILSGVKGEETMCEVK